jgi:hypothetical protein
LSAVLAGALIVKQGRNNVASNKPTDDGAPFFEQSDIYFLK